MIRTPWGNAADLRSMKMRPGRGNAPEESERSQRERLFGAMVAISSEQGYEATKIGDLAKLAGVSRAAFYEHFANKKECLLAAVEALVEPTIARSSAPRTRRPARPGCARRSKPSSALIASQPAAVEDGLHRGLRRRPGGRSDGRAGARHLRTLRGRAAEPDPGPQGHAAADGAGDDRRPPEGDPQAPLQRRSRPAAAAGRGRSPTGASPTRRRPGRSRRRGGAGARRGPSPSARPSPTRPSGSCGRWRRSSPRRATRRPRSPRSSKRAGHLPAGLLRALREQRRGVPRRARQRLGADAGRGPARLPPGPKLAGVGAGRLRGDVRLRDRRARVHPARRGRDVHGRQAGAADPRHG